MPAKKILVVDDETDVLKVIDKRLSGAGYSVLKALCGRDAIDIAKRERPDLILLDILMPGMDGGEVAAALRSEPLTKDIPVVFLTCLVRKGEEESVGEGAGKYFVAKPYDPDELLREIDRLIL